MLTTPLDIFLTPHAGMVYTEIMARYPRLVVPGLPHHVTQRGNRRQRVFRSQYDLSKYCSIADRCLYEAGVRVLAFCLMPNHVHLIAVPPTADALRRAVGEAHRRYTRRVNFRQRWRGHLWQGRFASFVLDDYYLLAATRYVELNPVRAGLAARAEDWPWSSAAAHLKRQDDRLVKAAPMLEIVRDWPRFLSEPGPENVQARLRTHENTGRPLGGEAFVAKLEAGTGRRLTPQRPGRPPKREAK